MKLSLKNIEGKKVGKISVPERFIDSAENSGAIRQAVLAELANLRQGTHSSKNRSSVRGGGKNLEAKGRGSARAGTIGLHYGEEGELFLVQVLTNIDKVSKN